jgi:hypothetical protein
VLLLWLLCLSAVSGAVDPRANLDLDIPAQALSNALEQLSQSTGMAVLVDRELTRGRRSMAVKGRMSAIDGLTLMLGGSGLMVRYARADAFTLQVAQVADVPGAAAKGGQRVDSSYATSIQVAIERKLCRSPLIQPGSFRALLQLWIGRDGVVQHSRLVSSTGDTRRDAELVQALRHLDIERPTPASIGQPVTLLLLPESSGKRMECTPRKGVSGG